MEKEIPTVVQSFSEVIKKGLIYVDKTKYIHSLIKRPQAYFLWRPRRFGKSLLLDTMAELFKGNRDLFRGLWIYDQHQFDERPVIKLCLDYLPNGDLQENIIADLKNIAEQYSVSLETTTFNTIMSSLVRELSFKFQEKGNQGLNQGEEKVSAKNVVILIDKYDAPILDHMVDNVKLATQNQTILHYFYREIKRLDRYIHFTFMTGVSYVAKVALGESSLTLDDISFDQEYAGICGFTVAELEKLFGAHFQETLEFFQSVGYMSSEATTEDLLKKIIKWYDGYNFDSTPPLLINNSTPLVPSNSHKMPNIQERVMNPFSIIQFFEKKEFLNYWLASEPPSFLGKLVAKDPEAFIATQGSDYQEQDLSEFSLDALNPVAILFQFGYLTLDQVKPAKNDSYRRFSLKIPNCEVFTAYREAFLRNIFNINSENEKASLALKTRNALVSANARDIGDLISTALSKLIYYQHVPNEGYYRSALNLFFAGLELDVRSDVSLSWSRPDLTLVLPDGVYACLELKYVPWPVEEQEKKLSANMTKLIQFQLSYNPFTQDQLDLFRYFFPDISLLSLGQKDLLSSTLARSQTLSNAQFSSLILKLQKDDESFKLPEPNITELAAHLEEELGPVARDALEQIVDKRYVHQYRDQAAAIVEVGVAIYGRDIVWAIARKIEAKDFAAVIEARDAAKIIKDRQTSEKTK
jgi:hypothetical protein